jgi:hypothetical protein
MSKVQVVSELWQFMRENKKFWLAPIIITLVLVGVLLVLAKSSADCPVYLYPILVCWLLIRFWLAYSEYLPFITIRRLAW